MCWTAIFHGASSPVDTVLYHTLLQIILILLAARVFGLIARRLGQPQVIGEMMAGVVLGPSLFGQLAPTLFYDLFDTTSSLPLSILSQVGLILLMFHIGLEFDFTHLHLDQNRRAVGAIACMGILLPAALGALWGWWSQTTFSPAAPRGAYLLFMAVALSITAMPVLGRIMLELKLTRTRLGTIAITSAAFGDVAGWILLAMVTALTQSEDVGVGLTFRLLGLIAFLSLTWFLFRALLLRWVERIAARDEIIDLGLLLAVLFSFALITHQLGIHAIFGGFWLGVLLHSQSEFVIWWRQRASGFITVFFVPIFFTLTGLRTNIPGLASWTLWAWCLTLVALATLGKFGGCWIAGRWAGLPSAEARCIAIMMNTRGLLELVVANIGYELKIIPQSIFTMLVFMALFSTALTVPCLRRWLPSDHRQ